MELRDSGSYVFVEVFDLGLVIQWDKGNRLYIRIQPRWVAHVSGLCGDFNSDASDEFKTPSGLIEASPLIFGDSWKLHKYCPAARHVEVKFLDCFKMDKVITFL